MPTDTEKLAELAEDHVEWLISVLIPIIRLIGTEEFIHGYKHCKKEKEKDGKDNMGN